MTRIVATLALFVAVVTGGPVAADETPPATAPREPTQQTVSPPASAAEARPAATQSEAKPVGPQRGTESAAGPRPAATQSPDDLICRNEREIGSRMSRKVCRTRAEMDAQQREVEEIKRQTQARRNQGNGGD